MAKTSKSRMAKRQQSKYSPSKLPNASNRRAYVKSVLESAKSKVSIPDTSKGRLVEESLDKWTTKIAEKKKYRRSARLTHNTNLDKKINALISDPLVINADEYSKNIYYNIHYPVKLSRTLKEEFDKTEQFRLSPKGTEMVRFLEENRPNQKITYGWEGSLYKEIVELKDRLESGDLEAGEYVTTRNQLSEKLERYLRLDVTEEAITNLYESAVERTDFMKKVREKINPDIDKDVFESTFWNMYRASSAHMKSNYDSMSVLKEMANLSWGEMQSGFDSEFVNKFAKKLDLIAAREQASANITRPKTRPSFIETSNRRSSLLKEQGDTPILRIANLTNDEFQELTGLMVKNPEDMFDTTMSLKPLGIETPNQFKPLIKVIKKANAKNGIPVENTVDNYIKIANMLKDKVSQDYIASVLAGVKHESRTKNLVDTGDALIEAIAFAEQEGILRRK